jgi:DNA-binding transcriptional LysR family regulator
MRRVIILGRGGSGKSTLARCLGSITGLPVIELDKLFWQPGLAGAPRDQRWNLANPDGRTQHIELKPRLVTSDLHVRLEAAIRGIGIASRQEQVVATPLKEGLVERVLSEWSGAKNILHLVYPTPRGMLPSVRSLIDYLLVQVPAWLQKRSI